MQPLLVERSLSAEPASVVAAIEDVARAASNVVERRAELLRLDLERGLAHQVRAAGVVLLAWSFVGFLAGGLWLGATVGLGWLAHRHLGGTAPAVGVMALLQVLLALVVSLSLRALAPAEE